MRPPSIALLTGLALAAPMLGPSLSAAEGVHEHGTGQMNLAVDGNAIQIELTAPGADIVGFEHEPKTDEAKASVIAGAEALEAGDSLFQFPADAGCKLESVEVTSGLLAGLDHDDKHGHEDEHDHGHGAKKAEKGHDHDDDHHKAEHADDHGDHGHKDEHADDDHAHKDDHAHDDHGHDDHGHEDGDEHAEFRAVYTFACTDGAAVERVATTYFDAFPNASRLRVQAITASGQRAADLTGDSTELVF